METLARFLTELLIMATTDGELTIDPTPWPELDAVPMWVHARSIEVYTGRARWNYSSWMQNDPAPTATRIRTEVNA